MAKCSNKPPPMEVRDSDEEFSDIDIYDEELLKVQRSEIHKIASRPVVLPITYVMQWIAMNVDFRRLAMVVDDGRLLGILTPNNFQSIYPLKPTEVKCNKEYLDYFYVANLNPHMVMKPWYREEDDFKNQIDITKYNLIPFISLVQYLTTMLPGSTGRQIVYISSLNGSIWPTGSCLWGQFLIEQTSSQQISFKP